MKFPGKDVAKIGLPLQVGGFVGLAIGFFAGSLLAMRIGFPIHLAGDVLFVLQMRKQGCL